MHVEKSPIYCVINRDVNEKRFFDSFFCLKQPFLFLINILNDIILIALYKF